VVQKRLARFHERAQRLGVDAYWLVEEANVRYLSAFTGQDSTLLVTGAKTILITDSRYKQQAENEAQVDAVVCRQGGMAATVAGLCKRLRVRRLALTANNVSHADYVVLEKDAPGITLKCCVGGIAERLRMRKDAEEIASIKAALKVAEGAFQTLVQTWKGEWTEAECAARFECEMRLSGAEKAAFEVICAAGERASLPHASPTRRRISGNSAALLDWGAVVNGYRCDLTRVLCTGKIPQRLDAAIETVIEAQETALVTLKPGVTCEDVDRSARTVIARAGWGRRFGHAVGHGVGLEVHEMPRLSRADRTVLLPGMVVTVEPGIYLPGAWGVRIEDMALVTEHGCEVLSTLPKRHRLDGE